MGSFWRSPLAGLLSLCLLAGPAAAQSAGATNTEGVTGLPADITPLLSIAGTWAPVPDKYIDHTKASLNTGVVANTFHGNILLANGREGIVATAWSCCEALTSIRPINLVLLEQQPDGTLQVATPKYVPDPQTNGGANVLVADFNGDGIQDFYLPAHNETPALPSSSTAYLSNPNGTYSKVMVADQVEAHGATVAAIGGTVGVFSASYASDPNTGWVDPLTYYNGNGGFTVVPNTAVGGGSSVGVGDFYADGQFSAVYSDLQWGPNLAYQPTNSHDIYLYKLSGLLASGDPIHVGTPYFNDKPQYEQYSNFYDPYGKTHGYRMWLDDFNHDGALDIVVQGMIWNGLQGQQKNILQMFQNSGSYKFADMTDVLNPDYDQDSDQYEYSPQIRDVDHSGVNSVLLATIAYNTARVPGNYVLVNDGTGRLSVALHDKLNAYGRQVVAWLATQSTLTGAGYYFGAPSTNYDVPKMQAYRTADGLVNFVAIVGATQLLNPSLPLWVTRFVFVNVPLRLDLTAQFTKPMVVRNRNSSHLIRTFAGDDVIYSGNNGGYSKVDGGMGVNTLVYSGPSQNYSVSQNADGTWTVKDNGGTDGTDTLVRIQKLQFTDKIVEIGPESGWWWDSKLNGTGFFIEDGGKSANGLFVGGFLFDANGTATWLVSTGQMGGSTYTSNWLKVTGGQTLLGPYKAPNQTAAGSLSITFSDSTHAVMTRPDGTQINLRRFSFTGSATPATPLAGTPQSGWWWAGSNLSGTGYGIEIQGSSVFIVAYVYDDAGNPAWYLATGSLTSPTSYSGTWDVYAGGPQLISPEGNYSAHKVTSASPMTLTFSDATHGTLTMGSGTIPIVRFQEF